MEKNDNNCKQKSNGSIISKIKMFILNKKINFGLGRIGIKPKDETISCKTTYSIFHDLVSDYEKSNSIDKQKALQSLYYTANNISPIREFHFDIISYFGKIFSYFWIPFGIFSAIYDQFCQKRRELLDKTIRQPLFEAVLHMIELNLNDDKIECLSVSTKLKYIALLSSFDRKKTREILRQPLYEKLISGYIKNDEQSNEFEEKINENGQEFSDNICIVPAFEKYEFFIQYLSFLSNFSDDTWKKYKVEVLFMKPDDEINVDFIKLIYKNLTLGQPLNEIGCEREILPINESPYKVHGSESTLFAIINETSYAFCDSSYQEYENENYNQEYANENHNQEYANENYNQEYANENYNQEYANENYNQEYANENYNQEYTNESYNQEYTNENHNQEYTNESYNQEYTNENHNQEYTNENHNQEYTNENHNQEYTNESYNQEYTNENHNQEYTNESYNQEYTNENHNQEYTNEKYNQEYTNENHNQEYTNENHNQEYANENHNQEYTNENHNQEYTNENHNQEYTNENHNQEYTNEKYNQEYTNENHNQEYTNEKYNQEYANENYNQESTNENNKKHFIESLEGFHEGKFSYNYDQYISNDGTVFISIDLKCHKTTVEVAKQLGLITPEKANELENQNAKIINLMFIIFRQMQNFHDFLTCTKNILNGVPIAIKHADRFTQALVMKINLENETNKIPTVPLFIGFSMGGMGAQAMAIKHGYSSIIFNPLGLGKGVLNYIGEEQLKIARDDSHAHCYQTYFMKYDWVSDPTTNLFINKPKVGQSYIFENFSKDLKFRHNCIDSVINDWAIDSIRSRLFNDPIFDDKINKLHKKIFNEYEIRIQKNTNMIYMRELNNDQISEEFPMDDFLDIDSTKKEILSYINNSLNNNICDILDFGTLTEDEILIEIESFVNSFFEDIFVFIEYMYSFGNIVFLK